MVLIPKLIKIKSCQVASYWYADSILKKMYVVPILDDVRFFEVVNIKTDKAERKYNKTGLLIAKTDCVYSPQIIFYHPKKVGQK